MQACTHTERPCSQTCHIYHHVRVPLPPPPPHYPDCIQEVQHCSNRGKTQNAPFHYEKRTGATTGTEERKGGTENRKETKRDRDNGGGEVTTELLAASYMFCGHSLCLSRFIEFYRAMACCRTRWLSVGHLRTRHQPTKVRCGPGEEHISENRSHSSTLPTVWLAKMAEASNQVTDIVTFVCNRVHPGASYESNGSVLT